MFKIILRNVILCAVLVFCGCAWRYVYQSCNCHNETHYCRTADGWDLAFFRFKPATIKPGSYPVILCPGLGNNSCFWDVDKKHSFAAYLRDKGYDVWSLSLRGSGKSTKPGVGGLSKITVIKMPLEERYTLNPAQFDWNADDHIDKDIPAAIKYVKEKTGMDKVNWIGHSLGAMIMCAYLEEKGDGDINSFVCVSAPLVFFGGLNKVLKEIDTNKDLYRVGVLFNIEFGAQLGAPLVGAIPDMAEYASANKENINPNVMSVYLSNVIEDISPGIVNQYLIFLGKRQFISADGKRNYTAGLNKIDVPILFVGGKVDNLAAPLNQFYAYYNVGSRDKTIKIFGKESLSSVDYGHTDIIIGKNAPAEVYPYIRGWLDERQRTGIKKIVSPLVEKEAKEFFR